MRGFIDTVGSMLVVVLICGFIWPEKTGGALRRIHDQFSAGWSSTHVADKGLE